MKRCQGFVIKLVWIYLLFAIPVSAQEARAERAANLRAQLIDVQARQVGLQTRLQAIDEEIKPENIERSLAGIGSTHPEELRAQRRRQLEIEKKGLQSQLETLAASRSRLETAIATAEVLSYQSAGPSVTAPAINESSLKKKPTRRVRRLRRTVKH